MLAAFVCLAAIAVLIHGYHPFSEDAAIYVPAIKKQLDPTLYPRRDEFFLSHARFSLFSIWWPDQSAGRMSRWKPDCSPGTSQLWHSYWRQPGGFA